MKKILGTALLLTAIIPTTNANLIVMGDGGIAATVSDSGVVTSYEYDALGNIVKEGEKTFKYADAGQLRSVSRGDTLTEYLYDDFGRMTSNGIANMAYDSQNNMMNLFKTPDTETSYGYDSHSGLRTSKTVDGKTIHFVLDSEDRVIAEKDANGTIISEIIWDGNLPSKYVYDSVVYTYVRNAHGDVVALLNEDGKTINSYKYDVWGQLLESNETVPNAIRYNHEYYDTESGFYYLRGRYYDPSTRRFTTPDPAEDGLNWYAYCGNNPVDFIDPSGYARVRLQSMLGKDYRLQTYVSGNDLDALIAHDPSKWGIAIKAAVTAKRQLTRGSVAGFLESLRKMFESKHIAGVAQKAKDDGKGICIDLVISTDGEQPDVPEVTLVPARTVEDLEKKHGRFDG